MSAGSNRCRFDKSATLYVEPQSRRRTGRTSAYQPDYLEDHRLILQIWLVQLEDRLEVVKDMVILFPLLLL